MTATTSAPATSTSTSSSAAGSGDQFGITLSGVANVVKSVEGLVGSSSSTASEVASAILDVLSFGQIGSTVGAQNSALNAKHVESLTKLLDLITKIKGLVEKAAQGYADADQATAQGFGGDTSGSSTGTSTTPSTLAATTGDTTGTGDAQQPAADAQQPAADTSGPNHNGLPDYVSPNAHPAVVGHDRQGHSLYDMTGHEAPTTRPAGDLDSWIADAKTALQANGVDTSTMSDSDLRTLIQHESSGNPNALNNWDSNARNGIPSKGLMQTIDPTFNDFALPGHTNIWNPTDNIIAGVRYGIDRYGSFGNIPGIRALHRGGGYVGY